MSTLFKLADIYNDALKTFEEQTGSQSVCKTTEQDGNSEYHGKKTADAGSPRQKTAELFTPSMLFNGAEEGSENILALGDNLDFMKCLLARGYEEKLDFIYIDPPFSTGLSYSARVSVAGRGIKSKAYCDRWEDGTEGFLSMLTLRLLFMKKLLSGKGIIAVHLDHHAVHPVRLIMDEIFGEEHFINELIWTYKSGGAGSRSFAKKHDTILVYSKSRDYVFHAQKEISYNRQGRPYNFKGVEEFCDGDGRWYTLVNRKDVISVDMVGRTSAERTGYATQKPLALLKILLAAFTDEKALCADFFCGSGSLGAAAYSMGRNFICCDCGFQAFETSLKRLALASVPFEAEIQRGVRPPAAKIKAEAGLKTTEETKQDPGNMSSVPAEHRKKSAEITVHSYTRSLKLTPAQQERLRKSRKNNPLALLDLLAADPSYDGKIFRAAAVSASAKTIEFSVAECGSPREDIPSLLSPALLAADAFGGMVITALPLSQK